MIFKDVPPQPYHTLENQQGSTRQVDEQTLADYVDQMFEDPDQFIVLTPPKAQQGIRYMQARVEQQTGEIEVEIAVQQQGGICLYYQMVSLSQCHQLFRQYFRDTFAPELAEYQPVEF